MKAERLLALLTRLLSGKQLSASALATELEVSTRTVYRDVEALCAAGFPVYGTTGRDGGFKLIDGFRITGQTFSTGEVQRILSALDGLHGVCPKPEIEALKGKFSLLLDESTRRRVPCPPKRVFIELTPSPREKEITDRLDAAIASARVIRICYIDVKGSASEREIEPAALVFYWQSWFVYAWCRLRKGFRLFRVARILDIEECSCLPEGPAPDLATRPWASDWDREPIEDIAFTAETAARGRLADYFPPQAISETRDGKLLVRARFPTGDWVLSWLMGLPGTISIESPASLRERMADRARELLEANEKTLKSGKY